MNNINPFNEFLFVGAEPEEAPAEETPEETPTEEAPDETTGTNEPVEEPADDTTTTDTPAEEPPADDQPNPDLAADIAGDTSDVDKKFDDLKNDVKKQLDEIDKKFDLEDEVKMLKRRLDNLNIDDETSLNDSLNQSAHAEINFIKRAIRRLNLKYKQSSLTGKQQNKIIAEIEANPQFTILELASKLASEIDAKEQDIFDFVRNTDYRFRHRHRRLRT